MQTLSIHEIYTRSKEDEKFILSKVSSPEEREFFILSLNKINYYYFLYTAFVEKEIQNSKKFLTKIGLVNSYYYEVMGRDIFNILDTFTYPLLSDNSNLISRYLKYERAEYKDSFATHFGKAVQSVMLGNQKALLIHINGLAKQSQKGWAKQFAGIPMALEGFLENNVSKIEEGIWDIIKRNEKQNQPPVGKDYINLEGAALAKLAYIKGLPVNIQSPLIPKEMLNVSEIKHTDTYNFLTESDILA